MSTESTVVIAYIHPNMGVVHERFAFSLAQQCANMGKRVTGIVSVTSPWPEYSRNAVIEGVLAMEERPDYLLWWDTDMQVPERALRDLIDHAEEWGAKAATVFGLMQRTGFREGQDWSPVPNAYWKLGVDDYYIRSIMPSYKEPFWCDATGLGFTLIATEVLADFPEEELPWHQLIDGGLGQDIRFFHHAGVPVLYDMTIRSVHWKQLPVDMSIYMQSLGVTTEEELEEAAGRGIDLDDIDTSGPAARADARLSQKIVKDDFSD